MAWLEKTGRGRKKVEVGSDILFEYLVQNAMKENPNPKCR